MTKGLTARLVLLKRSEFKSIHLRQQKIDQSKDCPAEKFNHRVQPAQVEQADDDEKTVGFDAQQEIANLGRCKPH